MATGRKRQGKKVVRYIVYAVGTGPGSVNGEVIYAYTDTVKDAEKVVDRLHREHRGARIVGYETREKLAWRQVSTDPGEESYLARSDKGHYWIMRHGAGTQWLVVVVPQSSAPERHVGRASSLAAAKRLAEIDARGHPAVDVRGNPHNREGVTRFLPGDRVEIAPHFDLWMRGVRYGNVREHSPKFGVYVVMDKIGKTLRFAPEDLNLIERPSHRPNTHIPAPAEKQLRGLLKRYGADPVLGEAGEILSKGNPLRQQDLFTGEVDPVQVRPSLETEAWFQRMLKKAPGYVQDEIAKQRERLTDQQFLAYLARREGVRIPTEFRGYQHSRPGHRRRNPAMVTRSQLHRPNPLLTVLGNPGGAVQTFSTRAVELSYEHKYEPEDQSKGKIVRHHPFKPGVSITALADGRVVLWRKDGKPVWVDDGRGDTHP